MSAPLPLPEPSDGNANRGPMLLAVFWVEAGLAMLIVAIRMYVRILMRTISLDDWAMLITLILFVCTMAISTVIVHFGLGRHVYYLTPYQLQNVGKWNWIVQPFGIMALAFGKISVSVFLLRIMGPQTKWRKWFLYANMVLFTIVMSLASIFSFVQCSPPRALWEPVPGAKCWNPNIQAEFAIFGSGYSAAYDFALALLPITIIWNLKLNHRQRIALCFLLGVGAITGICASVKAAFSKSLGNRVDATWATVSLFAWSASEVFLNIVCGSVPTLKPLYDQLVKKKPMKQDLSYEYNSTELSGRSGKSKLLEKSNSTNVSTAVYDHDSEVASAGASVHRSYQVSSMR